MRTLYILLAFLTLGTLAQAEVPERKVAYIEETTVEPDGSTHVNRYKPGEEPVEVQAPQSGPHEPRQRDLNSVEKQELYQLEADFAHGKISESEYNLKKRALYRATFVDGAPDDDNILYQSTQF